MRTCQPWKRAWPIWKTCKNIRKFGLPVIVAINRFSADTEAELDLLEEKCQELGVPVALTEVWEKGGEGGLALAEVS